MCSTPPPPSPGRLAAIHWVAIAQAILYVITGIWPLISIDTFQMVTGPKVDLWLVRVVGLLVTVIGGGLMIAALRRRIALELRLIAIGAAVSLAAIDIIYVWVDRIAPIYLADAALELIIAAAWVALWRTDRPGE